MLWSQRLRSTITDLTIILGRTDYGERDRILTLLSAEHGKLRAIAKGVRAAKSKLAGGIELFAENELVLLEGKGELYTVISSRMKRYFGGISKDLDGSMYVYECLKTVNKLAPDGAGEEYYQPLVNLLTALDKGEVPTAQIEVWYGLKLLESLGASPNFKTDSAGKPLAEDADYQYDFDRHCFYAQPGGPYETAHVKILRHLAVARKPVAIKNVDKKTAEGTRRLITLLLRSHDP